MSLRAAAALVAERPGPWRCGTKVSMTPRPTSESRRKAASPSSNRRRYSMASAASKKRFRSAGACLLKMLSPPIAGSSCPSITLSHFSSARSTHGASAAISTALRSWDALERTSAVLPNAFFRASRRSFHESSGFRTCANFSLNVDSKTAPRGVFFSQPHEAILPGFDAALTEDMAHGQNSLASLQLNRVDWHGRKVLANGPFRGLRGDVL